MKIEIIPLALKKMSQRGITVQMVKGTVLNPDQIVSGYANRKVRQKIHQLGGKEQLLRVVGDVEKDRFVVVTAYLTSKIKNYWRDKQ